LDQGRPVVEAAFVSAGQGRLVRRLLADTGGGSLRAPFEVILGQTDAAQLPHLPAGSASVGGAFSGQYPTILVLAEVPGLSTLRGVFALLVPPAQLPTGLDGIAGFRFLNAFHYGNFGDPGQFGIEAL
jgi:hypothetical protein